MQIFAEIQKAETQADGTLLTYGIASAPVRDAHGEIVTKEAMAGAIEEYMRFPSVREQHDPMKAAGTGVEISLDDDGRTVFVAKIVDKQAIDKVKHRVYRGFSIGGKIKQRNPQDYSIISAIELQEISLVDRPSCPVATLDLWKRNDVNDFNRADADAATPGNASFEDQGVWEDGFDIKPTGPSSVNDGGPYRNKVPERPGQAADAGNVSMPTDPNSGKPAAQAPQANATQDTSGGTNTPSSARPAPNPEYFSPIPGAMNKMPEALQNLFRMITEMYAAQQKPPVHDAVQLGKSDDGGASEEDRQDFTIRRSYTIDQRKAAAQSGAAMADGSYPIHNRDDLATAVRAFGKAKNPEAAKEHMKRRAHALGAENMLPGDWGVSKRAVTKPVESDTLASKLSKTDDLLANTIASVEKMEVRFHRGHATPEAYRLAKLFKEMPLDELAEVLALDTMAKIAHNDTKVITAESLAKQYKTDNDALMSKLEETQAGLATLSARVQKLSEMPLQLKTAGSIHAMAKEGDNSGVQSIDARALQNARQQFEGMSDDERAMLMTKVALSHPRKMNLNPVPNPPRSVGGTAGREDLR